MNRPTWILAAFFLLGTSFSPLAAVGDGRIVEPVGGETLTTFLSDYRDVRGLKLPFALRVVNGDPKYDQLYIIASVDVDVAIETASFAVPRSVP